MPLPITIAFSHMVANYEFHTSNFVLLLYDHILTFGDEVERIWSRPLTFPVLLFYLNRYLTLFQYIIIQLFMRLIGQIRCRRYVRFAGASTTSLVAVAELIMILRVYALYLGNNLILAFLLCLLAGQVIVSGWAVHNGMRVPQPLGFPGCTLTGKNTFFAALWGAPLVTDSCIFFLTSWRTIRYMQKHGRMTTMQILLRDGTMYFFVVFSVNLMNTLIYFLAARDLKAVGASFSQILTSIMISRLQLNLRCEDTTEFTSNYDVNTTSESERYRRRSVILSTIMDTRSTFFTLGNLGGEMKDPFLDERLGNEPVENI